MKNKSKIIIIFVILLIILGLYKCNSEVEIAVGDFTKPVINVNGQL